jgi:hypothetical protein
VRGAFQPHEQGGFGENEPRREIQIMGSMKTNRASKLALAAALVLPAATFLTGCQVEMAGQTLPSPYYLTDDVQYYAPGPEFKLAREAAAMQEQAEAIESEEQAADF